MMKRSPEEAMDTFLNATTAAILAQLDVVAREALPTISEKDLWRLKKLILGEALEAAIKGGEQLRLARRYVAALTIAADVYVVVYTSETRGDALRTLGRWASTPGLNFGWASAAVMAKEIREATKQ